MPIVTSESTLSDLNPNMRKICRLALRSADGVTAADCYSIHYNESTVRVWLVRLVKAGLLYCSGARVLDDGFARPVYKATGQLTAMTGTKPCRRKRS